MKNQAEIQLDDGKYVINAKALHKVLDEPSVMASYLSEPVMVTKEAGRLHLTLMLLDHETITGFQVENDAGEWIEAEEQQVNEETNRRFELYSLDRLMNPLQARVQYEVEHDGKQIKGDEILRLSFDEESLEKADMEQD